MKPPNFWTDYFKKPPFSHHNAPANRNCQAASALRNTQNGAQGTRHGCQRNARPLPTPAPPPAQSRPLATPKSTPTKHTTQERKAFAPLRQNKTIPFAGRNHTFHAPKPYLLHTKTTPFAPRHKHHCGSTTYNTPCASLPPKRHKRPKKTRGNLDGRQEYRNFAGTKQLFPNGTPSPSTPHCGNPRRHHAASRTHIQALPSTAPVAFGRHHPKHRHGLHSPGIAQRPPARRATSPLPSQHRQS